ncbi:MAG TPA: CocE/NonD family hydrolase [Holophagaceae bacterium]|nr:CocE/NonD family hydrolase [Holophagaceae bacterium]
MIRALPLLCIALVAQQPAASPLGKWGGSVKLSNGRALGFSVLFKGAPEAWSGTFSVPDQGLLDSPIADVKLEGRKLAFTVPAVPGGLSFKGELSEDGKTFTGEATQGDRTLPFTLERDKVVAVTPNPVQERYTKQEVMIPMRDGVKLFTQVYAPKDTSKPHPILLQRTPYSVAPYGAEKFRRGVGPSPLFLAEDYIVVYQDVRGRWMSEGDFVDMRPVNPKKQGKDIDEGTDTYDTIDWLVKNVPANNGRVGQWGISYPGHYTIQGMLSGHPALVAVSPQAPMIDIWQGDDTYHNGAFQLAANFSFFTFFQSQREKPSAEPPKRMDLHVTDGYRWFLEQGPVANLEKNILKGKEPIWTDYVKHTAFDAYWQARNLRPHLHDVKPAVMTVGGWFDAEDLYGPLATYRSLAQQSPATDQMLVMGPWTHGEWASGDGSRIGNATFGSKTSAWYQQELELKFFNHHLKGAEDPKLAKVNAFETGANRWRQFETWPPKEAKPKSLYFEAKGRISFDKPSAKAGFDEFIADPNKPVPYTQDVTFGYTRTYMTEDQRFASSRPDVMVYETEPLTEDLTLAGPLNAVLNVSTTGTDADFVVKLVDVFPDGAKDPENSPKGWHAGGYQMLVRGETIRGKYRGNRWSAPVAFTPGKAEEVAFTLPDVLHTFQKGHRLMIQVQCSWFPLVDRNPQVFTDIPNAKPEQFRKATQRIFRSAEKPSRLEVKVLP